MVSEATGSPASEATGSLPSETFGLLASEAIGLTASEATEEAPPVETTTQLNLEILGLTTPVCCGGYIHANNFDLIKCHG